MRPLLEKHPRVKKLLKSVDRTLSRWNHSLATTFPALIRPQPRQLTVAITAACNLSCAGCRYGRDFMVGSRLSLAMMRDLLEDAKAAGISRVRLYGGEPLLHPDLPEMIRYSSDLGMDTYITTNGTLLKERIDELYGAGLRWLTIGFYGEGASYDQYTAREGHYARLEASLQAVREKYGGRVGMQLNYVLLRSTTNMEALHAAWNFALRYEMYFHLDLYMHEIPFFTDGPDDSIAFQPTDRPAVQEVVDELVRMKQRDPQRFPQSLPFMRSVTDWLILGAEMTVPCDANELLWVGADGTVQLCDVTFKLGNLHETRLRDFVFGKAHKAASVDAFKLNCPNCTCKCDSRIMKHAASLRRYGDPQREAV